MQFVELNKDEFSDFLNAHPLKDFVQTAEMEEIGKLNHHKSYYVGIKQNNKIIAATRVMLQKGRFGYFCYAPRGLLVDYKDKKVLTFFVKELSKYLKAKKGYKLVIEPNILYKERDIDGNIVKDGFDNSEIVNTLISLGFKHEGFTKGMDTSKQVRWIFVLPLKDKTEELIWNEMRSNTRNLIRKAEKIGIKIQELSYEELPRFKKITEETGNRRNFHDRDLVYYQKMYKLFAPKNEVKFLLASLSIKQYLKYLEEEKKQEENKLKELETIASDSKNAKNNIKNCKNLIESYNQKIKEAKKIKEEDGDTIDLAASMFIIYNHEIIYLFSGNIDKYMKFNAQYLIQWYMIKYGLKHDIYRYNFYGISGIFDKNDKDYGVYEFKRNFNGHVEEYIGSFSLPLSLLYKFKNIIKK